MPDTSAPSEVRYPSRKSLRTQPSQQTTARNAVTTSPSSDATVDDTPQRLVHRRAHTEPMSGSVRVPRRAHVPDRSLSSESTERPQRTARAKFSGVAAATSVCGLVLAAALPLTENASFVEPAAAAAEQRLFSTAEAPVGSIPDSLSDISAVETDDSLPTAYTFRAESLVNYPFTQTVLLTDPFGYRTAPVEQFHDAQDFAAAAGTPIQAIADGEVLEAGFATDGCGFGLKLEHEIDGKDVTSRYCHMQMGSHSLAVGDQVKMGDDVGKVGNTGMSFGPHLHLALVVDDEPTDPMPFLAKYSRVDR